MKIESHKLTSVLFKFKYYIRVFGIFVCLQRQNYADGLILIIWIHKREVSKWNQGGFGQKLSKTTTHFYECFYPKIYVWEIVWQIKTSHWIMEHLENSEEVKFPIILLKIWEHGNEMACQNAKEEKKSKCWIWKLDVTKYVKKLKK